MQYMMIGAMEEDETDGAAISTVAASIMSKMKYYWMQVLGRVRGS